ncbi:MAG: site-specific recombinase [Comamonadaceae bacterium]|nr:site-specific recombinase [Comamonadaceae bacterium]
MRASASAWRGCAGCGALAGAERAAARRRLRRGPPRRPDGQLPVRLHARHAPGTIGIILGLPIDIRHIAFSSANLGYALVAFDFALPLADGAVGGARRGADRLRQPGGQLRAGPVDGAEGARRGVHAEARTAAPPGAAAGASHRPAAATQ